MTSTTFSGIRLLCLTLLTGLAASCVSPSTSPVRLNEVLPSNSNNCPDEVGERNDWVELYNTSDDSIDLGGYSLTDDTGEWVRCAKPTCGDVNSTACGS